MNAETGAGTNAARPTVTVAIPTRNRGALIGETLAALTRLTYSPLEILVVDQSTDRETFRVVNGFAARDARIHHHATTTIGSAAGRNIAAHVSAAEIIAYTDDDCIVEDNWLSALVTELCRPGISAVYGRILSYDHQSWQGSNGAVKDCVRRVEYSKRVPPWYIGHGGNMAFRRNDLLDVGGFDPLLGAGSPLCSGEDSDIAYRLLVTNRRIVYSPDAVVYHRQWKKWRERKAMEKAYGIGAGAEFAKYLRCRDAYALQLLAIWIGKLGARRLAAGLLKWHSAKVMYVGGCQLIYPWVGMWKSRRFSVDAEKKTYLPPSAVYAVTPEEAAHDQPQLQARGRPADRPACHAISELKR